MEFDSTAAETGFTRWVGGKQKERASRMIRESGVLGALILLLIVGAIISPHFLKPTNLINVIRNIAISGILGVGMTFVILTSGIDLSVGAIVGFVSVISAGLMRDGVFWPLGAIEALKAADRLEGVFVVGIDGQNEAFDAIAAGEMTATITYPNGGAEGVEYAFKILSGEEVTDRLVLDSVLVDGSNVEDWIDKGF